MSRLSAPLALLALLAISACANPLKTVHHLIEAPQTARELPDRIGSAELLDVSLPEYAAASEVAWQTPDGAVRAGRKELWADDPRRAVTLTLARAISDLSGATVISEPWPLAEPARHRLDVRIEHALAGADGIFRLSGRYFLSDERGGGSNLARSFDIRVPLEGDGPGAIAHAQGTALGRLARQIAALEGPGTAIPTSTPPVPPLIDPFSLPPLEGL